MYMDSSYHHQFKWEIEMIFFICLSFVQEILVPNLFIHFCENKKDKK